MSADLLLTHGYILDEDEKEREIMRPYPPLGLLYLSAYLKRRGYQIALHDSTMSTRRQLQDKLAQEAPVVGFYSTMMTRNSVVRAARFAREKDKIVILGGPDAGNYPEEYLQNGAHVVVRGEGERSLEATLQALPKQGPHRLHSVAGISFADESGVAVHNPPAELIEDLDSLPWPDREAIDLPAYMEAWSRHHGENSINLITARGCPYKCNWCSHAVYGYTHRRRSPRDCAEEVAWIRQNYQPDQLWYADDVFTINHRWLFQYHQELKDRGLTLPFETISRADRMMKTDVVQCLADMGCKRIWIGSESGSQRILDAMERGVTKDQVAWSVREAQRHGIEVGMFLMWGYEGEEFEDVEQTVDFVAQVQPDIFFTTLAYPIKNTGYFQKVEDRVTMPGPWDQISDREHGVRGRPGRDHFRSADQWLKASVKAAALQNKNQSEEASEQQELASQARAIFLQACRERSFETG